MRGRWNWPGRADAAAAVLAFGALGAPAAPGQLLDLKPGAGTPGVAGEATAAIIDHLHSEASRLRDELGRADAKAAGELAPQAERAFTLRIAARERAADLLALATSLGDAGAPQALAALALIARFDAIDAWGAAVEREPAGTASTPTPAGDAAFAFITSDADLAAARDDAALDRWLARSLGPRAQALGPAPSAAWDGLRLHASWVPAGEVCTDPTPLADLIARWSAAGRGDAPAARDRRLSPDSAAALRAFDEAQGEAPYWADGAGTARIEQLIRSAGRVMDGLDPAPPREATDALATRFESACKALGAGDPACVEAFERLAAIVAIVDDTARALSTAPRGVSSGVKDQIWKYLWSSHLGTALEDRARRDSLRRSVDAVLRAADGAPDEDDILRECRPMLRRLRTEMEMAQRELWTSVPRPTARNPMDDPGIVGSLATVRRLDGAVRGLAVIGGLIEPPKGVGGRKADPGLLKVRDRLLALAKDMEKPATHDAAQNTLLALLDAGDAFTPGDAERALRASPTDATWTAASSGKCPELLAALDAARLAALKSWGEAKPDAADALGRVRSLARLVELVHAGAIAGRMTVEATAARAGVISRHPGVELSGPAAAALLPDLEPAAARLVPLVLTDATRDLALKEVDRLHAASAGVRLFARLEVEAVAMQLAEVDPAIELSAAPGPRPWLGDRRDELALICWNAHELAGAQLRRDREQIARRTTQINDVAARVLESLDRR